MELGKHLGMGIWGLADKALPVVYGLGFVLLVIRVLPEQEFGNFVLIQEIFLVITGLGTAIALQPLLKYASEEGRDVSMVLTPALLVNIAFLALSSLLVVALRIPLGQILKSPLLPPLLAWVPVMLFASLARNVALILLQARFEIQRVFWVDSLHFLGAPILVWVLSRLHLFDTALDLIVVNVISLSLSSVAGVLFTKSMLHFTLRGWGKEARDIWDYGKYSLGGVATYLVYTKADSFILAAAAGPLLVAVYNAAKVFTRVFEMVTQIVQMFVLPMTSLLSSRRESASLHALVEKAITFTTIGMVPVFLLFLLAPSLFISVLYGGRYGEAIPILQIFSCLALVVPLMSVGSNVLLGMGEARANFILGVQMLVICLAGYLFLIPPLAGVGAALAYVLATVVVAVTTLITLKRFFPLTLRGLARRERDIRVFVRSRLRRNTRTQP